MARCLENGFYSNLKLANLRFGELAINTGNQQVCCFMLPTDWPLWRLLGVEISKISPPPLYRENPAPRA